MKKSLLIILASLFLSLTACSVSSEKPESETLNEAALAERSDPRSAAAPSNTVSDMELPDIAPGETLSTKIRYTDPNGDIAIITAEFTVSANKNAIFNYNIDSLLRKENRKNENTDNRRNRNDKHRYFPPSCGK